MQLQRGKATDFSCRLPTFPNDQSRTWLKCLQRQAQFVYPAVKERVDTRRFDDDALSLWALHSES